MQASVYCHRILHPRHIRYAKLLLSATRVCHFAELFSEQPRSAAVSSSPNCAIIACLPNALRRTPLQMRQCQASRQSTDASCILSNHPRRAMQ